MSMLYHFSETHHFRQNIGMSDVAAPVPRSEVKVYQAKKNGQIGRLLRIEDKDGKPIKAGG